MAKNQVTLTFAGDAGQLEKAAQRAERSLEGVGDAADQASTDIRSASRRMDDGFDTMSEGADTAEQRIMGVRDIVDGTAAIMQGPGEAGISAYLQGWADLASGIVNAAIPALQAVSKNLMANVAAAARATAAVVANVARQVAAWVMLGVQSMIQAARVAAAWIISMGPIGLIIAAVVGLVALIIANWDTIERVIRAVSERIMSWVRTGWGVIKDMFARPFQLARTLISAYIDGWLLVIRTAVRTIKTVFSAVKDHITAPFRAGFNAAKAIWNTAFGGRTIVPRVAVPDWVPRIGGNSFGPIAFPRLHAGGIVPGPAGADVPIMAMAGERVMARGAAGGGGSIVVNVTALDPRAAADAVLEALMTASRRGGRSQLQTELGVSVS